MPAWTAHEDEIIRAHAKTHSATQIAGLLPGRSRAAVTGRAWRLGASLAKDETTRLSLEHPKRRRVWAAPPTPPPANPSAWPRASRAARLEAARVTPRMSPLEEVGEAGCRWPYGDERVLFCGEPARAGSAYCRGHHGLAYVPVAGVYDPEGVAKEIERKEARLGR